MSQYTQSAWAAHYEDSAGPFADNTIRAIEEVNMRTFSVDMADSFLFLDNAHDAIQFVIDGGGSTITTGVKGDIQIPFDCVINGWDIYADQTGSIVVDVWKDTYANFPPTIADTIAGSEKPTISTAVKNQDLSLSTWTTTLTRADILRFSVDSVTSVQRVTVVLRVKRSS